MTTFPPKKETQVFENFLFINERIWDRIFFVSCKKKILRNYMHDSYKLCVTFTTLSFQWKIDKWHDGLQCHLSYCIYYPNASYWGGIRSCPHIHIYRNISNSLLGKEKFLLHQVMHIIIEFVNVVVSFQVWWQLKYSLK